MASLERINYQKHRVEVSEDSLKWTKAKRKPIDRLPQIFWEDNSPWSEANLWALDQASSSKRDLKTVQSNMSHLLAYAKWLESESIDWWYFPERESERCLVRFRGALVYARNNGELAPSTTSQRMSSVIRFYKWVQLNGLISTQWPIWKKRIVGVKVKTDFGLEHTMRIESTDLAIPNRKVSGSIKLEDGVLPVSLASMNEILNLAESVASKELSLMLKIGFYTGLRIGSISNLKVATIENATYTAGDGWMRISVGPGARPPVETKFDVSGTVPIPRPLLDTLIQYSTSTRRLKREMQAEQENKDLLFLTRYGNPYNESSGRAINVEMSRLRNTGKKLGIRSLDNFHFHRTRATFATELTRIAIQFMPIGDAIQFVRECCLHKDDSTTMRYIKFLDSNVAMSKAADAFTKAFMGLLNADT